MKVLQVNKLYPPDRGGIEDVVKNLSVGDTHQTTVLVCQKKLSKTTIELNEGLRVIRAASFGMLRSMPTSISFFYWFWKEIKNTNVITVHYPFPLAALALALFRPKVPVIIVWHSAIVRQRFLGAALKPLINTTLKRASAIVTTFPQAGDYYRELLDFRDKLRVIPFGVKQEFWQGCPVAQKADQTVFVYAGRLVYYKGLHVLIDACAQIKKGVLRIVGEGPLEQELREKVASLGLEDRVSFVKAPTMEDFRAQICSADVFVFPSSEPSEVFGLVQVQAMAAGKPLINTSLPTGVPWVARDNQEALTVNPGDSAQLAHAMQKYVDQPELGLKLGAAGAKRAKELFTLDKMRKMYYDLYQSLINR